jgi:molybdopterin-guanine dinucleotide biosynthesis protein A
MKLSMPAAVLAGGASRRMGRPKASLPYGGGTLLAHQTSRLAVLFEEVVAVCKTPPDFEVGPARILCDRTADLAAMHGLARALEHASDRVFVLAVDLPLFALPVARALVEASLGSRAAALLPVSEGRLQPLAAVWRRSALPEIERRIARGDLSLQDLARAVSAEVFAEERWRALDPSGRSFDNVNTIEDYLAVRERA